MSKNDLKQLPDTIEWLYRSLRYFDSVNINGLTKLPDPGIYSRLCELEQLHVRKNKLVELPARLSRHRHLRFLDATGNRRVMSAASPSGRLNMLLKMILYKLTFNFLNLTEGSLYKFKTTERKKTSM